jgi:hypothetical protein
MNSHQARAFEWFNPAGQLKVFKAIRKRLPKLSGDAAQALVRSEYSPRSHPDLYTDPKKAIQKLQVKKRGRKRKPLTRDEKRAQWRAVWNWL